MRAARGLDRLPVDVRDAFRGTLVRALEPEELLRALRAAVEGLLREAGTASVLAAAIESQLRDLTTPENGTTGR